MSLQEALSQFITMIVVIDPSATIALYLLTVRGLTRPQARLVAMIAPAISFLVLMFFIVFFQLLLEAMHIPMPAFQLAGSIVWFILALHLVFDRFKADDSFDINTTDGLIARAVSPLAIPGIAGPGTMMTVTMLTENYSRSILEQAQTAVIVALSLAVVSSIYLAAEPLNRLLGKGGLSTISRVMGLILASIAMANGIEAVKLIFGLK
jgi:multiple antibiotic resistance protein